MGKNTLLCLLSIAIFTLLAASHVSALEINLDAIKSIESSNNPLAYNAKTRCFGFYQISKICLQDYNDFHNTDYQAKDLFFPILNKKIAVWYFKRIEQMLGSYTIPITMVTVLASYNWGIGNVARWHAGGGAFKNLPKMTQAYIRKYKTIAANGK